MNSEVSTLGRGVAVLGKVKFSISVSLTESSPAIFQRQNVT